MIGVQVLAGAVSRGVRGRAAPAGQPLRGQRRQARRGDLEAGASILAATGVRRRRRSSGRSASSRGQGRWRRSFRPSSSSGSSRCSFTPRTSSPRPPTRNLKLVRASPPPRHGDVVQQLNGYTAVRRHAGRRRLWLWGRRARRRARLTSEREGDTWVSLIATPLTPSGDRPGEDAGGVLGRAMARRALAGALADGAYLAAVHPFGFLARRLVIAVYLWFACRARHVLLAPVPELDPVSDRDVTTLIVCNGLYLLPLIPFQTQRDDLGPRPRPVHQRRSR